MILFALFSLFGCAVAQFTEKSKTKFDNAVNTLQKALVFLLLLFCVYMIFQFADFIFYCLQWRNAKKQEALEEKQRKSKRSNHSTKVSISTSKSKSIKKSKKDKKKQLSSKKKIKKSAAVSKESKSAKSSEATKRK